MSGQSEYMRSIFTTDNGQQSSETAVKLPADVIPGTKRQQQHTKWQQHTQRYGWCSQTAA
jgi:hypothetical protein